MKLTTKGHFAVTAMVDLAMNQGKRPVALASISERQKISLSYLEQLFSKLRRRGLVESVRGPGGGYRLAHDLGKVSIADIVIAVDESLDATQCRGLKNCRDEDKCITHNLWAELNQHIYSFLSKVTLEQLVARSKKESGSAAPLYDMRAALQASVLGASPQ